MHLSEQQAFFNRTEMSFSILVKNRVVHGIPKRGHVVARDQQYNNLAAHWSDVHRMLYEALPVGTVKWGHEVMAVDEAADGKHVKVHFRKGGSSTVEAMQGNLLIAADGSMSETRKALLPHEKRRLIYAASLEI